MRDLLKHNLNKTFAKGFGEKSAGDFPCLSIEGLGTGMELCLTFFFFLTVLGFELRASHLLGRHSTT
jgi:hypothetical protein